MSQKKFENLKNYLIKGKKNERGLPATLRFFVFLFVKTTLL